MKFTKSDVFEMVDALFHFYASDYRNDAKEELAAMIQRREDAVSDWCGSADCPNNKGWVGTDSLCTCGLTEVNP